MTRRGQSVVFAVIVTLGAVSLAHAQVVIQGAATTVARVTVDDVLGRLMSARRGRKCFTEGEVTGASALTTKGAACVADGLRGLSPQVNAGAAFRGVSMTTWREARELVLVAIGMVAGGVLVFGRADVGRQRARLSDERSQPFQQVRRVLTAAAGIEGQVPARHGRASDYAAPTVPTIRKNP